MQNRQLHFVEPEEEIKCFNGPPRVMKQVRGIPKLRFGYTASRGVACAIEAFAFLFWFNEGQLAILHLYRFELYEYCSKLT